jgi:hypothetical protein
MSRHTIQLRKRDATPTRSLWATCAARQALVIALEDVA